jgi:hypothetical protein
MGASFMAAAPGLDVAQARKVLLFLKKKKQKDFCSLAPCGFGYRVQMGKSFLVLFFKKERLS